MPLFPKYFNFDQESPHSRPDGCNGPLPMAAIAARADLQQSNVSCTWQQHDFMVGKRAYGAIDAKVLSSSMSDKQSFLAVAGPTTQVRIVCNPI